jgi:hypothetical protein
MAVSHLCACLCFLAGASAQSDGADIVVLLDVGQNMTAPASFVARGARLAAYELGPTDRIAVMSFSSSTKVQLGLTSNTEKMDEALRKATRTTFRVTAKHPLYDAIREAIDQFPQPPSPKRRSTIVVITNDVDGGSVHTPDELIREAKARGVAIWVFLVANPYPQPGRVQNGYPRIPYPDVQFAADQFRPIAEKTGGNVVIRDMNGYVLRQAIAACKGNLK